MGYVNLGAPYDRIIKSIIEKGYAGNQTEVIRQALINYEKDIEEEEMNRVRIAIEKEMEKVRSGEEKVIPLDKALKILDKKHGLIP